MEVEICVMSVKHLDLQAYLKVIHECCATT